VLEAAIGCGSGLDFVRVDGNGGAERAKAQSGCPDKPVVSRIGKCGKVIKFAAIKPE